MSKRKRLRKLAVADRASKTSHNTKKLIALRTIAVCSVIAIISGLAARPHILGDFITSYREQYHLIVHGTINYCSQFFNYKDLLSILREKIYGQDSALNELENVLRHHANYTAIGIVGTTGVGKTFLMNLLRQYYPWKDNVQHYVWSTYQDETEKYQQISSFLRKLSDCGHNLILIDDLTPKDKHIMLKYQALTERSVSNSNRSIKLIIIYVFNVLRYSVTAKNSYAENVESLQNLHPNIKTVNFKELNSSDVEKCIRAKAFDLNVALSSRQLTEIVQSVDVFHFGCKNVHAKITQYSTIR